MEDSGDATRGTAHVMSLFAVEHLGLLLERQARQQLQEEARKAARHRIESGHDAAHRLRRRGYLASKHLCDELLHRKPAAVLNGGVERGAASRIGQQADAAARLQHQLQYRGEGALAH